MIEYTQQYYKPLFKGAKILDVATGHGKFAENLAKKGHNVTAFDGRDVRFPKDGAARISSKVSILPGLCT